MNCLCRGLYVLRSSGLVILWAAASAATCWFYMAAGAHSRRDNENEWSHEAIRIHISKLAQQCSILWPNGVSGAEWGEWHLSKGRNCKLEKKRTKFVNRPKKSTQSLSLSLSRIKRKWHHWSWFGIVVRTSNEMTCCFCLKMLDDSES